MISRLDASLVKDGRDLLSQGGLALLRPVSRIRLFVPKLPGALDKPTQDVLGDRHGCVTDAERDNVGSGIFLGRVETQSPEVKKRILDSSLPRDTRYDGVQFRGIDSRPVVVYLKGSRHNFLSYTRVLQ